MNFSSKQYCSFVQTITLFMMYTISACMFCSSCTFRQWLIGKFYFTGIFGSIFLRFIFYQYKEYKRHFVYWRLILNAISVTTSLVEELAVEMPESPKGEEHLITVIETELHSQPHETLEVVVTEECIESPVKKIRKEEIGTIFVSNH